MLVVTMVYHIPTNVWFSHFKQNDTNTLVKLCEDRCKLVRFEFKLGMT